jgi:hypothetical protein
MPFGEKDMKKGKTTKENVKEKGKKMNGTRKGVKMKICAKKGNKYWQNGFRYGT